MCLNTLTDNARMMAADAPALFDHIGEGSRSSTSVILNMMALISPQGHTVMNLQFSLQKVHAEPQLLDEVIERRKTS